MKKIFLFSLLLPFCIYSQNYQPVQPDQTAFFEPLINFHVPLWFKDPFEQPENKPLRAIQIKDSVTISVGYLYENFCELQDSSYSPWILEDCVYEDMPSWIGNKIYESDKGNWVFFNRNADSIFIKPEAGLNTSWRFYNYSGGAYFMAQVFAIDTVSFLGITDTVKFISIQRYNSSGDSIYSDLNGTELWLSKNYGFLRTINFRDFPGFEESYSLIEHQLVGHSLLYQGFHLPTRGEIWNFEAGDEFHIIDDNNSYYTWSAFKIMQVIQKQFLELDKVKYTIANEYWGTTPGPDGFFYHAFDTNTLVRDNLSDLLHPSLPFEPYLKYDDLFTYNIASVNYYNGRSRIISTNDGYDDSGEECLYPYWFDSYSIESYEFIVGCGTFHSFITHDGGLDGHYFQKLVYYKKGDEEWGIPLTSPTVGTMDYCDQEKGFSIYPNPVSGLLSLHVTGGDFSTDNKLIIYDSKGNTCATIIVETHKSSIDVRLWPKGIYFYNYHSGTHMTSGKIIMQ